jgi:hypothetical protein
VIGIEVVVVLEATPKAFCFLPLSIKALWGGTQDLGKWISSHTSGKKKVVTSTTTRYIGYIACGSAGCNLFFS